MRLIILTYFLLLTSISFSQNDTVVSGKTYNYIEYYSNGAIKILGTIEDSVKVGKWIFFHNDSSILATGKFTDGYAKGRWKYYSESQSLRTYNWNWKKDFKPITKFVMIEEKLIIKQEYVLGNGRIRFFENGRYMGGFRL